MRHPLHPALVHFPIACWTLAAATDIASLFFGESVPRWSTGLLLVGSSMAMLAIAVGFVELTRVPPDGPANRDALLHMGIMMLAFVVFSTRLLRNFGEAPDAVALWLDAAGFICLAVGGWLGGRLVYVHGIGVWQTKS